MQLPALSVQGDIAAFKDYTAEDAKEGGAPKKQPAKPEGKQEAAPAQKSQQQEQKPAPPQPKQSSGQHTSQAHM